MKLNGCHNRLPFAPSIRVADGWLNSWARNMVDMEFRMDPNCVYSTSDLGQVDKGCIGCSWRANGQADTGAASPAEPVQVGNGVATVRPGESGLAGIAGPADVGGSTDVAEHGGAVEQARAAEELERLYPGAAMYRPINQCDGCRVGAPLNEFGHHRYADGSLIGCTKSRYQPTEEK